MTEPIEENSKMQAPGEIRAAEEDAVTHAEEACLEDEIKEVEKIEEEPMIEVHAPHESVHTWRDILIHIGIITVGLLLAVGLEQTVEYFHHRHQVAETREALRVEREVNIGYFAGETEELRRMIPLLRTNLAVYQYLRKHPGAPKSQWPGEIHWMALYPRFKAEAWKSAEANDILRYMPQAEVQHLATVYDRLQLLTDANQHAKETKRLLFINTVEEPDPGKLSPAQLDEQIRLTAQQIRDYSTCSNEQFNVHAQDAGFVPAPTAQEFYGIVNVAIDPHDMDAVLNEAKRMNAVENLSGFDLPNAGPANRGKKK